MNGLIEFRSTCTSSRSPVNWTTTHIRSAFCAGEMLTGGRFRCLEGARRGVSSVWGC